MATAEELLSGVLNGTTDSITVDSDLRRIVIPDSIRNIGVESDEEVLELKFSFPRYYGRFDLSEFKIWVNYLTANGEPDAHEVKEIVVDEDTIAFIWQVGRHTTSYRGDVIFALTLRKYFGHIILKEFNTTVATLPVLEGLQTGEAVVQNHADLLEQWRIELFGLGDSKVQAIENAGDVELAAIEEARAKSVSAVQAVETNILDTLEKQRLQSIYDVDSKGVEVLAAIPEDYTAMNNQVEMLTRFAGPVIRQEANGKAVIISDSSNNPLLGLNIYGKSEQFTTTGANILPNEAYTSESLGIKFTVHDDGSVHTEGTATGTIYLTLSGGYASEKCPVPDWLVPGETYFIKDASIYLYKEGGGQDTYTDMSFVMPEGYDYYGVFIRVGEGVTVDKLHYPMINKGSVALSYEPYTGGKPSPNPEYPQSIIDVGNSVTHISGKNLLNIDQALNDCFVKNADGTYTVKRVGNYRFSEFIDIVIPKDTTITVSVNGIQLDGYNFLYFQLQYADKTADGWSFYDYLSTRTINVKKDVRKARIYMPPAAVDGEYKTFSGIQVEINSEATEYEPYVEAQTFDIGYSLPGILNTRDSHEHTYIDSDGNGYIANDIQYNADGTGELHNRLWNITLTGDESISIYRDTDNTETYFGFQIAVNMPSLNIGTYQKCSHFVHGPATTEGYYPNVFLAHASGYAFVRTEIDGVNSVATFKQWLADQYTNGTPVQIVAVRAEFETVPLSATELEAFKALHTNYPNTTVMNDSGAHMKVIYAADTKIYIDNKFAELKAAITGNS